MQITLQPLKNGKIQDDESKVQKLKEQKRRRKLRHFTQLATIGKAKKREKVSDTRIVCYPDMPNTTLYHSLLVSALRMCREIALRDWGTGLILTTIIDDGTAPGRLNTRGWRRSPFTAHCC